LEEKTNTIGYFSFLQRKKMSLSPFTSISRSISQLIDEAEDKLDQNMLENIMKHSMSSLELDSKSENASASSLGTLSPPQPTLQPNTTNNQATQKNRTKVNHFSETPTRSIFIGNLDPTVTDVDLKILFKPHGRIESIRLLPNKECAFVNFITVEEAMKAKQFIKGKPIGNIAPRIGFGRINSNGNNSDNSANGRNILSSENGNVDSGPTSIAVSRSVWVGQLSSTASKEALMNAFSKFGHILNVRITSNKSCAFVDFYNIQHAIKAKNSMNGVKVAGSIIKTGYARGPRGQQASYLQELDEEYGNSSNLEENYPNNTYNNNNLTGNSASWITSPICSKEDVIDIDEDDQICYTPNQSPITDEQYDLPIIEEGDIAKVEIDNDTLLKLKGLTAMDCIKLMDKETEQLILENILTISLDINGNILAQRIIERLDMQSFKKVFELFYPYFLKLSLGIL
jgi:RNA recognition motif-containing protein